MRNRFQKVTRALCRPALLIVVLMLLANVALAQKVTYKGKDVSVKSVLKSIEKSTGYTFVYASSLINDNTTVSLDVKNASLSDVLAQVFLPMGVSYKISDKQILLQPKEMKETNSTEGRNDNKNPRQTKREVKGKVVDQNGQTLPGVTITLQGTSIGTTTDVDGNFTISVPDGVENINVSYIGFQSKMVKLTGAAMPAIKLEPSNLNIDEVVVVAYGTSSKKAMTGAVTSVSSDAITRNKSNNVISSLQGMVPGLQMTSKAGSGGSSSQEIIIRGNSSINASNEPLYIIDGVPSGSMNSLNPEDIESISVLKDASAISLYGARATNGVILVTTKQGVNNEQRTSVTYSGQVGISTRTGKDYKTVGAKDFYELSWEALKNGAVDNPALLTANGKNYANAAEYASYELVGKFGYNAYDKQQPVGLDGKLDPSARLLWWENFDKELIENGIRHEHNISVSGGTKRMKSYASVGYLNQQGLEPGSSGFERLTTRLNFSYDISKSVQVGATLSYTKNKSESESVNGGGTFHEYARRTPGLYSIYKRDPNGNLVYDSDGKKILDWGDGPLGIVNSRRPGVTEEGKGINPLGTLDLDNSSNESNNVNMNFFVNVKILEGLSLRTTYASNYSDGFNKNYTNSTIGSQKGIGKLSTSNINSLRWTFNTILTYQKSFVEGQNFKILVGAETNETQNRSLYANSSGFLFDGMEEHGNASTWEKPTMTNGSSRSTLAGIFSRLEYDMYNRYFVSASLRRDGASNFHPDNRWGNFWSVGGSWIFSSEEFMKNLKWLSLGKLRASYGTSGNIGSPNYRSYYKGGYTFLDQPAFNYSSMANKDLKWEINKQFNVGMELSFLNNRIGAIVEYYNRITDDLFYNVPLSPSTGFNNVLRNIGSLRNRGIEVTINTDNIRTDDFKWSTSFNIANNRNKILSLNQDEFVTGNRIYKVGMSTTEFFVPHYAGVNPDNGNPTWYIDEINTATGERTGNQLKTENFAELSNKTIVLDNGKSVKYTNLGKYEMGNYTPKVSGGMNNTFRYKGIDFSFLLTYSLGSTVMMDDYMMLMSVRPSVGSGIYQFHEDMLKRWQKPGDITDVPRITTTSGTNYYNSTSSNRLRSGDYLKLKNIVIGYTFPENMFSKLKITSARVFFQADNVYYWSTEQGFDPEQVSAGSVSASYPAISTYSFGVKLSF